MENTVVFWSQKVNGNMMFTDYFKILVLNFSEMGNTIFFWAKELMEKWYLLSTEKFMFWTFWRWEIWSVFELKSWWKDDICLVFLSFPWYIRTWEIWFFVQWTISIFICFIVKNVKKLKVTYKIIPVFFWYNRSLYYYLKFYGIFCMFRDYKEGRKH